MPYPVDDRYAILPPPSSDGWFAVSLLLLGATGLLWLASRWFGDAPAIYAVIFGIAALLTLVVAAERSIFQGVPKAWLKGDILDCRHPGGSMGSYDLGDLGGAFVVADSTRHTIRIFLAFRSPDEEASFRETGFPTPPKGRDYAHKIPFGGVVGVDSMQAQYFADEINRRRGLVYKWRAQ